jgi:hypothetical protein
MVGLHLDLRFQVGIAQAARHLDDFGNGGVAADRDRDLVTFGSGTLHGAPNRLAHSLRIDQRLFIHGVGRRRLGRVRLDPVLAAPHRQLNELY